MPSWRTWRNVCLYYYFTKCRYLLLKVRCPTRYVTVRILRPKPWRIQPTAGSSGVYFKVSPCEFLMTVPDSDTELHIWFSSSQIHIAVLICTPLVERRSYNARLHDLFQYAFSCRPTASTVLNILVISRRRMFHWLLICRSSYPSSFREISQMFRVSKTLVFHCHLLGATYVRGLEL